MARPHGRTQNGRRPENAVQSGLNGFFFRQATTRPVDINGPADSPPRPATPVDRRFNGGMPGEPREYWLSVALIRRLAYSLAFLAIVKPGGVYRL
jgi:hypothetical protein